MVYTTARYDAYGNDDRGYPKPGASCLLVHLAWPAEKMVPRRHTAGAATVF